MLQNKPFSIRRVKPGHVTHQLLEEVSHTLLLAPGLDAGQQAVVEVLVDLVELRNLEENGLDLLEAQDGLRGGGRSPQRLHGLEKVEAGKGEDT